MSDPAPLDLLDVRLLDICAHLDSILGVVREIQRDVLRLRGTIQMPPVVATPPQEAMRARFLTLHHQCDALKLAVESGAMAATKLT